MLEVIERGSTSAAHPTPLLFVHGGWHGAWCWEHFLDYFADAGYRAVAVSLRGHGNSPCARSLHLCSVADYIEDIAETADRLGTKPVLIAHSLGGFVVQRFLESRSVPAAVLLASIPPQGVFGLATRVWRRQPWITVRSYTTGNLAGFINTPPLARQNLFCAQTPEAVVAACAARVQPEGLRAAMIDAMFRRVRTKRVSTPMLVLGAADDGLVSRAEVQATAHAYGTEAEFFPNMGHNMMMEPGWPDVAERIHAWLGQRDPLMS
ncbi:alpha/beta hydrolase [Mycobacterium sp. 1423905.2]|uniref:alpha/beta hydrolase n=1 Tax=Mycobacterium sp. 1423905.2 TaxID=1856859 RepID=UPI000800D296|nr:alpha/beta fold hydrolase [Mycobacterium sp. 1423905.2]OBJ53074.1 alpha/beta hydrolase [Mycobacterium sp. 1423905.2]